MKNVFVLLTVSLLSVAAQADVASIKADEKACLDVARANNEMKQCVWAAYEAGDKELNLVYGKIVARLKKDNTPESTEILNRLVKAERAWIPFRDANCSLEGTDMLGGTGESLIIGGCLADATLDRITALLRILGQ